MLIQNPEIVLNPIWEGELTPEISDPNIVEPQGYENLPIASIGAPEVWELGKFFQADDIPIYLKNKLERDNFYVIRFVINLRASNEIEIKECDFIIQLINGSLLQEFRDPFSIIAYDLYPQEVTQELEKEFYLKINPEVTFEKFTVKPGEFDFGIKYKEVKPIVIANGQGKSTLNWKYKTAKGITIEGIKVMYLILKTKKNVQQVIANMSITATTEYKKFLLNFSEEKTDYLKVQLIPELKVY